MYALRRFSPHIRIFSANPYFVDYGGGVFGCFQVPAQARRAISIHRKIMSLGEQDDEPSVSSVTPLGAQASMSAQPFSDVGLEVNANSKVFNESQLSAEDFGVDLGNLFP